VGSFARGSRELALKTKLLLMMLSLLALSGASLFLLHLLGEQELLSQVRDYTEELSTAIEIAQKQPGPATDLQLALQAYAEKLRRLGVKDVTLVDAGEAVQASTDPRNLGRKLVRGAPRKKGFHEFLIRGTLGDADPSALQHTSTLTVPLVVGDRRVGNLLITRYLDDFSALSREAFVGRMVVTFGVFAVGIVLSLYLAWSVSRPILELTRAARQVAGGDLAVEVPPRGGDEVAGLARTFNEMVGRLRENRRLEERLHFAERTTAMGRLAAAVAHEIRNPLNFLNLSIDHLRQRLSPGEDRPDVARILGSMKAELLRLNRLVGDFLSLGKPMRLDRRPGAVGDVLRDVAALVEHKARDQRIDLRLESDPRLPEIIADGDLLKTCFLNLLINALDAMPDGGVLSVAAATETGPTGAERLVITVRDTGPGMSAEEIKNAFEPYFSTKETGLGLGLALTRKIVTDHGGAITLESTPGGGTTARLELPAARPEAPEAVAS
jgi:signal transduction histidine kinase